MGMLRKTRVRQSEGSNNVVDRSRLPYPKCRLLETYESSSTFQKGEREPFVRVQVLLWSIKKLVGGPNIELNWRGGWEGAWGLEAPKSTKGKSRSQQNRELEKL